MSAADRIGFLQGRLSAPVDGRIQAFPWPSWQEEFALAERFGFGLMEWTLDQDRLYENPLMTREGQLAIRALMAHHGISIPSLTGDCFMQAPFWKADGEERARLVRDFAAVATACPTVGISLLVVPLVDNGRIENAAQEAALRDVLLDHQPLLEHLGVRVLFESDADPLALERFIDRFDPACFGINYDIGNSAALGFDPVEEIAVYGDSVMNVHVKDRARRGGTVPLGSGAADFDAAFGALKRAGYAANFILQTARAVDGDHTGVLCRYRNMTATWLGDVAA